jgi:hypothetical protein
MGVIGAVGIYLGGRANRGWWQLGARPNEGRKKQIWLHRNIRCGLKLLTFELIWKWLSGQGDRSASVEVAASLLLGENL